MTSIFSGFDSVQQILAAQQYAISITQRNVANANNESYTRQEAIFADAPESNSSAVTLRALRNRYLDYSISRETQSLGEQQVTADALQQVEAIMNESSGQGLQQALSDFFNSFNSLSATPEDLILRQQVLSKAAALASEFHRISDSLQQVQIAENDRVETTIEEINAVTSKIASLNERIGIAHAAGYDEEYVLRDERQQSLEQLSGLIDISYLETESGAVTVTTRQGGALVIENQSHDLERCTVPGSVFSGVQLDGVDITSTIQSGTLAGLLQVRDGLIAGYLGDLDDMAAAIISRVNQLHTSGFDLDNQPGGDFFEPWVPSIPGSSAGAARAIRVSLSDGRKIAASSSGNPGDGDNATRLYAIHEEALLGSSMETIGRFYAGLIYKIGSDEKSAAEGITTQTGILNQLKNQRSAETGVNLDEEATNLIKYQKTYQASAKFMSVLDLLSNEILSLLG
jgi:flagellar hook-associated protein 1 FlgK